MFDAAEYLNSEEDIQEFMTAAFESGDPAHIAKCLGIIARARNMSQLARDVGMTRAALYRALSGEGNPEFATIVKVLNALGIGITPVLKAPDAAA
ncbi:MAG: putative addiction module antidote protein [Shinella sp.]|nr:putative addiction module antidote protein [Shinella sp.]